MPFCQFRNSGSNFSNKNVRSRSVKAWLWYYLTFLRVLRLGRYWSLINPINISYRSPPTFLVLIPPLTYPSTSDFPIYFSDPFWVSPCLYIFRISYNIISWSRKPLFGLAWDRILATFSKASLKGIFYDHMRYPTTIVVDLETPQKQCTRTFWPWFMNPSMNLKIYGKKWITKVWVVSLHVLRIYLQSLGWQAFIWWPPMMTMPLILLARSNFEDWALAYWPRKSCGVIFETDIFLKNL